MFVITRPWVFCSSSGTFGLLENRFLGEVCRALQVRGPKKTINDTPLPKRVSKSETRIRFHIMRAVGEIAKLTVITSCRGGRRE